MKRLGLAWVAAMYVAALIWGETGVIVTFIAGCVLSLVVFIEYVPVDPYGDVSELDRRDGVGDRGAAA